MVVPFSLGGRGERPLCIVGLPADYAKSIASMVPGAEVRKGALMVSWEQLPALYRVYPPAVDLLAAQVAQMAPAVDTSGLDEYVRCFGPKLRAYQKEMVKFLALRAYAINGDPMRCLAGKTRLTINRGGKACYITMERLVQGLQGQLGWNLAIPTKTQSMDAQGSIVLNTITFAHKPGKKPCMRVTLSNGSVLECTAEHKLLTPRGKVPLQDLRVGDFVLVAQWPQAQTDWKRPQNKSRYLQGFWDHPYAEKGISRRKNRPPERYARVKKHRLAAEASASGLPFDEFVRLVRTSCHDGLVFLDPAIWHVHHRDGDHTNNDPLNLEVMTQEQHSRRHGVEGAWRHVNGRAAPATIVSLEYVGEQEVYDLTMANPLNNYVAEGVVVSNSGKTPTTLAAASLVGARKVLIACPSIAKLVWATEINKWLNQPSLLLYGRGGDEAREFCIACAGSGRDSAGHHCPACRRKNGQSFGSKVFSTPEDVRAQLDAHRFIIVNYDILTPQFVYTDAGVRTERTDLPGWAKLLEHTKIDLIIGDEGHILRGRTKKRERAGDSRRDRLVQVARGVLRFWLLSGTPIFGRVADLWSLADLVTDGLFGRPFYKFDERYANGHRGEYGWENDGISNPEELKSRLDVFMLKRLRSEILPELPKKQRQVIRIDPAKKSFTAPKKKGSSGLHAALRTTAAIKRDVVTESVVQECGENAKVVVFAYHREGAEELAKAIAAASADDPRTKLRNMRVWCVTGDTSTDTRFKQAQAFREWKGAAAFVATIDSVPVAISLNGAQSVHFADLTFDPASLLQAEDRPYEVGTTGLTIIYYLVTGTVDEHVLQLVLPKMEQMETMTSEAGANEFRTAFGAIPDLDALADTIWQRMEAAVL